MNFYNEHPFRVVLDYAHNAHGMQAMARTVRELNVTGRRIGVLAAPGDRRDEDILELARAAAPAFDFIILREDDNRRGRQAGESGALVRQGLVAAGFPEDRISPEVYDEVEAVQRALETSQQGDLLVIFGDDLDRDWNQIVTFGRPADSASESTSFSSIFTPDEPPLPSPVVADSGSAAERQTGEHED
jgi:cyanophycin synthetase